MSVTFPRKYVEVIVSENDILLHAIEDHFLDTGIELLRVASEEQLAELISSYGSINSLILDRDISQDLSSSNFVQNIVNLSGKEYNLSNEISIRTPMKLSQLIQILKSLRSAYHTSPIYLINHSILLNFKSSEVLFDGYHHRLTEKEMAMIKAILLAPDFFLAKKDLMSSVWGYDKEVETNTIETHIYRLKQKLPEGFLLSAASGYHLAIKNLQ